MYSFINKIITSFQISRLTDSKYLSNAQNDNSKKYFLEFIIIFCLCFLLVSQNGFGQSLSQLELNYQNIAQEFFKEQAKLDSLNIVHNKMISDIDKEKQKESTIEYKIKQLLAEAVVVSNQIKAQQSILGKIESNLEILKVNLDRKYVVKIDSLKILENSNINSSNKKSIKSLKLEYIEKRLIVAPKIYSLSFDPKKLIQFHQSSGEDSLLNIIYLEYLNNALEEVNQQSQQLALLKNEIEEVVNLQNEAYDFIEDIDSEILFNPAQHTSEKSTRNAGVFFGGDPYANDEISANINFQAISYLNIFNQLKTSTNIDLQSQWETPTDTIPANLTFQQYLELLENVDKMLQDYKTILEHKLESNL